MTSKRPLAAAALLVLATGGLAGCSLAGRLIRSTAGSTLERFVPPPGFDEAVPFSPRPS